MRVRFDVDDAAGREDFLRNGLPAAIAALTEGHAARFGAMGPQEMVEHLAWAFDGSTGRRTLSCPLPEDQIARAKRFLSSNRPTPENFMNPLLVDGLPMLSCSTLAAAKEELNAARLRFVDAPRSSELYTHPVFGPLGHEDWHRAHFKHCCHHLFQFGLVDLDYPAPEPSR